MGLEAIPKTRVGEAVYNRLLSNIRDGVWKSGEKLPSENALCELLNVSRVSVRSAIQRLRALGLVETTHGKGSYVTSKDSANFARLEQRLSLSQKEFDDLNDLREALEPKALEIILKNRERTDITPIVQAYQAMRAALEQGDEEEFIRQDYLFHLGIINATGNSLFIQIINIFKAQYYNYLKEISKFIFQDASDSEELARLNQDHHDCHTLIYQCLTGERQQDSYALMNDLIRCNKERFKRFNTSRAAE